MAEVSFEKISFEDKENIRNNTDIAEKNKITDKNINEIKKVINNNADSGKNLNDNINLELRDINESIEYNYMMLDVEINSLKNNFNELKETNEKLQEENEAIKSSLINKETEEEKRIHIEDAGGAGSKLEVLGNAEQKTTTTQENVFNGRLELGAWDYNSGEKVNSSTQMRSVDYIDVEGQTQISIIKKDGGTFTVGIRYYANDKSYIGRASINNVTDATTTTIVNNLDDSKTVKYATLTFTHLTDVTEKFAVNKGADLEWHDFIPNSPSLDYPSEVRCLGDNKNILKNEATNQTINGINFKINNNKSITAKGTATGNAQLILLGNINGKDEVLNFEANKEYKNVSNTDILYRTIEGDYGRLLADTIFSFDTEISIRALYILINSGETVDKTYYPKIIKYKEGIDESYSIYGQGSTEIKCINKNFYKLDTNPLSNKGVDYTVENGMLIAKRTAVAEAGSYFQTNRVKLPAGTYTISGIDNSYIYEKARIEVYASDLPSGGTSTLISTLINTRLDYTYNSDKPFYISFNVVITSAIAVGDTFVFRPQVESKNIATEIEEHKEQNYILPIQEEMLTGDYFIKEDDVWKEVHNWTKVELTGDESIIIDDTVNGITEFGINNIDNAKYTNDNTLNAYSNYFKATGYHNSWYTDGTITTKGGNSVRIMTSKYTTVEDFKAFLKEKYDEGNPVVVYYKLVSLKKLNCTEEQIEVLEQLSNLKLYKYTNNIFTAEDIAKLKLNYVVDTKKYIDNIIANTNKAIVERS